jgi:hypothetical protein
VCQSAPGGVKTGIGTCHGVWWPPIPGWCRKLGARRAFPRFVPRNVGWHQGGQRNRGTGLRHGRQVASSERPRGDGDPGRVPSASRARPHYALSQAKSQTTASLSLSIKISFPAQSFVSRSKHRIEPVHHIWIPPLSNFCCCFVMLWRRRGDGEQEHTLLLHDGDIFPPKMTKK